jgi:ABC-type antimicrobial peptide transport system permease subunit
MALVLRQALALVSVGLMIGLPIAFWTKQIAGAMVENLSADSLFPIFIAIIGTIAVSLLAAWVPARRATRVDPLAALRSE